MNSAAEHSMPAMNHERVGRDRHELRRSRLLSSAPQVGLVRSHAFLARLAGAAAAFGIELPPTWYLVPRRRPLVLTAFAARSFCAGKVRSLTVVPSAVAISSMRLPSFALT